MASYDAWYGVYPASQPAPRTRARGAMTGASASHDAGGPCTPCVTFADMPEVSLPRGARGSVVAMGTSVPIGEGGIVPEVIGPW